MYDICPRLRYEAEEFLIRTGYPKVAKKASLGSYCRKNVNIIRSSHKKVRYLQP